MTDFSLLFWDFVFQYIKILVPFFVVLALYHVTFGGWLNRSRA